jgi:uncharacterized protein YodC (DUF2158 family)
MFKAGETVKLNSGGPLMTILSVGRKGVKCAWATKDHTIKEKTFPAISLTKHDGGREKLIAIVKEEEAKRAVGGGYFTSLDQTPKID